MITTTRFTLALCFMFIASLGAFACGGGDDGETKDEETTEEPGRTNIECVAADGVDDAVCVTDEDCPEVESGEYRSTAKDCLLEQDCLGQPDEATCVADCLVDNVEATAACAGCYGISAACSAENCLIACAEDGDAPDCVTCQEENGCTQAFFECSGLQVPS